MPFRWPLYRTEKSNDFCQIRVLEAHRARGGKPGDMKMRPESTNTRLSMFVALPSLDPRVGPRWALRPRQTLQATLYVPTYLTSQAGPLFLLVSVTQSFTHTLPAFILQACVPQLEANIVIPGGVGQGPTSTGAAFLDLRCDLGTRMYVSCSGALTPSED